MASFDALLVVFNAI